METGFFPSPDSRPSSQRDSQARDRLLGSGLSFPELIRAAETEMLQGIRAVPTPSHDRDDAPDRPRNVERPDRPQRPERPERPRGEAPGPTDRRETPKPNESKPGIAKSRDESTEATSAPRNRPTGAAAEAAPERKPAGSADGKPSRSNEPASRTVAEAPSTGRSGEAGVDKAQPNLAAQEQDARARVVGRPGTNLDGQAGVEKSSTSAHEAKSDPAPGTGTSGTESTKSAPSPASDGSRPAPLSPDGSRPTGSDAHRVATSSEESHRTERVGTERNSAPPVGKQEDATATPRPPAPHAPSAPQVNRSDAGPPNEGEARPGGTRPAETAPTDRGSQEAPRPEPAPPTAFGRARLGTPENGRTGAEPTSAPPKASESAPDGRSPADRPDVDPARSAPRAARGVAVEAKAAPVAPEGRDRSERTTEARGTTPERVPATAAPARVSATPETTGASARPTALDAAVGPKQGTSLGVESRPTQMMAKATPAPPSSGPPALITLKAVPGLEAQLAAKAKEFLARGKTEIRIALDPPELGKLKIRLTIEDSRAVARIVAASGEAATVLSRDREELTRAFQAQGFEEVHVEIEREETGNPRTKDEKAERRSDSPSREDSRARDAAPEKQETQPQRATSTLGPDDGRGGVDLFV